MNRNHRSRWLLAAIAVGMATHATAQTADPQKPLQAVQETSADSRVAIDPVTGKLRPLTAQERQQLSAQDARKARRSEPLGAARKGFIAPATEAEAQAAQRRLPNGGLAQQVPESMMTQLMVTRDADGQLRIQHAGEGDDGTPGDTHAEKREGAAHE
ncbi:hypothetical protein [Pseudoxanthomonas sp. UTMC 1351]|uniref:post-PEP-CTERM-1 domain-containing protein n=1 Tax=Pseudoxanthomonas sp. UTMC 1351 TaxID=2695853 RepID=UPI0034CDA0EA